MKKKYFISIIVLVATIFGSLNAQVVNGNFETVKPNNLVSNWGMNFSFPVTIDLETGQSNPSPITFGCWPGFVFPSWDAHQGNSAMQLTNALDQSTNTVIPAKSILFNDSKQDFPGWNPGVPLNTTDSVTMLGFYYKFSPMGNDVAEAELIVMDADGQELGRATVDIMQTNWEYNYLFSPVQFTASGTPALMFISFSMAKEGSVPNFGSTLIIDDVIVNVAALANDAFGTTQFAVYPTVASNEINILKGTTVPSGNYDFTITNMEGKIVNTPTLKLSDSNPIAVNVSQLSKGVYFISAKGFTTKFVKQ
jgi:hypothetical protein